MVLIKRIFLIFLAFLIFNLYLPKLLHEQEAICYAKATVTKYPLEVRSTPDKKIPVTKKETKKGKGWLWGILGVIVIGGVVAAAGGGSDSGDDESGSGDEPGGINAQW